MTEYRWWRAPEGQAHAGLIPVARSLYEADATRRSSLRYYLSLYEELVYAGSDERGIYRSNRRPHWRHQRRDRNVVRSIANAAYSEASHSQTRVQFVTDDASYERQCQAEDREAFVDGEFRRCAYSKKKSKALLHASIFGTGIVRVFRDGEEPGIDVVHPWSLFVDDIDASHGEPRAFYERLSVDKWVLAERFPEYRAHILSALTVKSEDTWLDGGLGAEKVELWQAYRLPSGPKAKDGRHVVALNGVTLSDVPYDRPYAPYCILYYQEPAVGFWGYGVGELLATTQESITRNEAMIEAANFVHGHARLWVPQVAGANGAAVDPITITNEPGTVNTYDPSAGGKPELLAGNILAQEIYRDRDDLTSTAYTLSGVSQSMAQNTKPAGLNSGKALRLYNELASKPLVPFLRACEWLDVEVATRLLDVAKEILKDVGSYKTKSTAKGRLRTIDLASLGSDDEFAIQPYPVSALSKTPSGRLSDVQEMIESGMAEALGWDPEDMLMLLDLPDTQAKAKETTAPTRLIRKTIDRILREGEYIAPLPEMDLKKARRLGVLSLQDAELREDVDDERLELLRTWIAAVERLQQLAAPPPPPPNPPPPPVDPSLGAPPVGPPGALALCLTP